MKSQRRCVDLGADRMLVRSCYTKSDTVSPQFDETLNRTTRNLQHADWAEYIVAWRKDRIEIYKDYVRCS